jgi:hypothetical protein
MLVEIPMIDRLVRLTFLLGICGYSFGITYVYTSKNYFYVSLIYNTIQYIYSLFFAELSIKYMESTWNGVINGLIMGYYAALFNFVFILGFLVYCDAKNYIDEGCILHVPLINLKIVTLHYMNHKYNLSFDLEYNVSNAIASFKEDIIMSYDKVKDFWMKQ